MKRIVVGTDGSPGAANAMRWAARLAASHGAQIVAMTGLVPTQAELPPDRIDTLMTEQQARLDEWSNAAWPGDTLVRAVVERGDPRPGILRVAARENADLIVVGRTGTSAGPGVLHIGSMAEYLVHHADRPIAVVGGAVNVATRSVLVGVDGSEGSRAALEWVNRLAGVSDVRVVVAAVEPTYTEWTPSTSSKNWRRRLEQRIEEDFAVDLEVDYQALVLGGLNVADELIQAAKDERTDVIVVGARGLGGFTGLRIGGVAIKTLHRADRPVVIIPTA